MCRNSLSFLERFWNKISKTETCWNWVANKTNTGYGLLRPGGQAPKKLAHRISWEIHRGPIPEGLHVLHRCDNPACVNPDHLFLGDMRANMKDMYAKGRGWMAKQRLGLT